jgi:hypothetical protein
MNPTLTLDARRPFIIEFHPIHRPLPFFIVSIVTDTNYND